MFLWCLGSHQSSLLALGWLLGTGDNGASCVFETCWAFPVGQVKWEGEISLSSLFFFFSLFLFLLLAAGRSPGTLSLLQSSDWNTVSHPGCQGTRCHMPAAVCMAPGDL